MGLLSKKTNPRRSHLRRSLAAERSSRWGQRLDVDLIVAALHGGIQALLTILVLGFDVLLAGRFLQALGLAVLVLLLHAAAAVFLWHYRPRLLRNHARALILGGLFLGGLLLAKLGVLSGREALWGAAWAVGAAALLTIVVAIAYDQRFALDVGVAFSVLAALGTSTVSLEWPRLGGMELLAGQLAAVVVCSFSLREIRKRSHLLQVGAWAGAVVFLCSLAVAAWTRPAPAAGWGAAFRLAGWQALAAVIVGPLVNELLPLIERAFRIAVSMTLLDYSDANQPLLKKLAMEAPGTFSHSLMIGSIAEAGAEAIGANGLLARVGAYYHDIGKINKPKYFAENEMGSPSKHTDLSPTMSQLIIIGHVKDGVEMAKEYKLPAVIRQFIETHHGTTLVEPFYVAAKQRYEEALARGDKPKEVQPPRESEFRYPGPKPRSKEAAILMIADAVEGAVRSLEEVTPAKVETVIANIVTKRLQDGQFDECDITMKELAQVEAAMAKTVMAHYHGRVAYPTAPDEPLNEERRGTGTPGGSS